MNCLDNTEMDFRSSGTMKRIILLPFALTLPLFAGTSAKDAVAPATPESCLFSWFAGGSVGYLTQLEEPMYNLHLGTDTCWNVAGWNVALFGEVGYTSTDESYRAREITQSGRAPLLSMSSSSRSFDVDEMGSALSDLANFSGLQTGYDLDIIPITFNVKLQRQLAGNLDAYVGAGLGVARVSLDVNAGRFGKYSDNDWVFAGQVFAGLTYNVNANFEVYGGARWIYFDDAKLSDRGQSATLELGSDCLLELGGRYNF